jgi:hypothetical protein
MPRLQALTSILILFVLTCAVGSNASPPSGKNACGEYQGVGVVKSIGDKTILTIFKGSQSEIQLKVETGSHEDVTVYDGRWVEFKGSIRESIVNYRGSIKIERVTLAIPDFLVDRPGQNFSQVTFLKCK